MQPDKTICGPASQEPRHVDGEGVGEKAWTAGPWRLAEIHKLGMYPNDGSVVILAGEQAEPQSVATVAAHSEFKRGQGHSLTDDPIRDANAHLIAAAPELYEALKKCRAELEHLRDGSVGGVPNAIAALIPERIQEADAALAKARGEQP